jgi:hypothetical protein
MAFSRSENKGVLSTQRAGRRRQRAEDRNTEANDLMRPLHDRMPVILDPTAEALWLDADADANSLYSLLA